jgi:amidase
MRAAFGGRKLTRITRRALAAAPVALAAGQALAASKPAAAASPWPDATEMAARIRKGELTALEAVEQAVARAEKLQALTDRLLRVLHEQRRTTPRFTRRKSDRR